MERLIRLLRYFVPMLLLLACSQFSDFGKKATPVPATATTGQPAGTQTTVAPTQASAPVPVPPTATSGTATPVQEALPPTPETPPLLPALAPLLINDPLRDLSTCGPPFFGLPYEPDRMEIFDIASVEWAGVDESVNIKVAIPFLNEARGLAPVAGWPDGSGVELALILYDDVFELSAAPAPGDPGSIVNGGDAAVVLHFARDASSNLTTAEPVANLYNRANGAWILAPDVPVTATFNDNTFNLTVPAAVVRAHENALFVSGFSDPDWVACDVVTFEVHGCGEDCPVVENELTILDGANDSISCASGQRANQPLPPVIDIQEASLSLVVDSFQISLQTLFEYDIATGHGDAPFGFGLSVDDPFVPNLTESDWYFDLVSDRIFDNYYAPATGEIATFFAMLEEGEFTYSQGVHDVSVADDGAFNLHVPVDWLTGTLNPHLIIGNGELCDVLTIPAAVWNPVFMGVPEGQQMPPPLVEKPTKPTWPGPETNFPPADNYMNGGSFAGSASGPTNRIVFNFELNGEVSCQNVKMISVFHVRDKNAPQTILEDPTAGYREGLGEGSLLPYFPPEASDALNGFVVDAPPKKPSEDLTGFEDQTDPKMPSFEISGNILKAVDKPNFLANEHVAYFETAVVCFDNNEIKVLGSVRWVHESGSSRLIPGPDGGVDWGPASKPFIDALANWMRNHPAN